MIFSLQGGKDEISVNEARKVWVEWGRPMLLYSIRDARRAVPGLLVGAAVCTELTGGLEAGAVSELFAGETCSPLLCVSA